MLTAHCSLHPLREAVARCPECRGHFCRECITEHDDRVICSACLKRLAAAGAEPARRQVLGVLPTVQVICGVLVAWTFFYFVGRVLISIPASFHEGTVWSGSLLREEE